MWWIFIKIFRYFFCCSRWLAGISLCVHIFAYFWKNSRIFFRTLIGMWMWASYVSHYFFLFVEGFFLFFFAILCVAWRTVVDLFISQFMTTWDLSKIFFPPLMCLTFTVISFFSTLFFTKKKKKKTIFYFRFPFFFF